MKAITEDRAFRLERNLTDAGCSRELIEQFFQLEDDLVTTALTSAGRKYEYLIIGSGMDCYAV